MTILGGFLQRTFYSNIGDVLTLLTFFHVNREGIMNIDRTNTVFEVLLHYLQYALEVLRVLR